MASSIIAADAIKANFLYKPYESLPTAYFNALERFLISHGTFCEGKSCSPSNGSVIPNSSCEYLPILITEMGRIIPKRWNPTIALNEITKVLDAEPVTVQQIGFKRRKEGFTITFNNLSITGPKIIIDKLKRLHTGKKEDFKVDATDCLIRYWIINGWSSNYQLALEPNDRKIYQLEIFASPFNVTANNWYSLYPDVDKVFGCSGKWIPGVNLPKYPAIEANCPFIECIQDAFLKDVTKQMKNHSGSILIVIADWKDSKGYELLTTSPYLVNGMRKRMNYYAPDDKKIPMTKSVEGLLVNL